MLRTIMLFALLGLTVVGLLIPVIPVLFLSLFGLRKLVSLLVYRFAQAWAKMIMALSGCTFTVSGREHIPPQGGICLVSNHGSILDIVLLLATVGRPIGFIAKKELVFIPLINIWILLLGGLFLDRKNVRRAVRTIKTGVARIRNGGAMIIFPEGHRSRGQGLLPFHQGSFKLATQSEAPVVPVAITGSYEVFEKTGRLSRSPVSITFLKPIAVADIAPEDRRQAVSALTREAIAAELARRSPLAP